MDAITATVRLVESLNVTGKLADLNVGQTYDLTEQLFNLFNQKPANRPKAPRKSAESPETANPVHVDMNDPNVAAQAPLEDDRWR